MQRCCWSLRRQGRTVRIVRWLVATAPVPAPPRPHPHHLGQIYGVVGDLMRFHTQTHGIVMGGANR